MSSQDGPFADLKSHIIASLASDLRRQHHADVLASLDEALARELRAYIKDCAEKWSEEADEEWVAFYESRAQELRAEVKAERCIHGAPDYRGGPCIEIDQEEYALWQ